MDAIIKDFTAVGIYVIINSTQEKKKINGTIGQGGNDVMNGNEDVMSYEEQQRRIKSFNRKWCTNHYMRHIIAVYKEWNAELCYKWDPYWKFITELTYISGRENVPYEVEQVVAGIWERYEKEMELYKED
jgi:hypothetical protein